ncbi:hypothetical protein ADL12_45315 [Streptomyces regalis]|uniref:Uncharacterized protein n=1 Tax=Streptomyces regalis TaxID=68262 RepID=A0A101J6X6_9ACTN|nr:hypothetical protein ADL12_45315 [Streptomyces regalis]
MNPCRSYSRRTALQHVQPDPDAVAVAPLQQPAQHGRTDAAALQVRGEIEVLQHHMRTAVGILGRPQ